MKKERKRDGVLITKVMMCIMKSKKKYKDENVTIILSTGKTALYMCVCVCHYTCIPVADSF